MKDWKRYQWPLLLMLVIVAYSCASMGTPDGGPYDEMPPKFVGSTPRLHAVNAKNKKIELEFDDSSRVFRKALNAACESMCTSSMIYTLYLPT